jgi:hypothetical protein
LCHDLLFVAGVLGNMCHDEGDYPTDDNYTPDDNEYDESQDPRCQDRRNEYRPEIGAPCDVIEYCSDESSNDPAVVVKSLVSMTTYFFFADLGFGVY